MDFQTYSVGVVAPVDAVIGCLSQLLVCRPLLAYTVIVGVIEP